MSLKKKKLQIVYFVRVKFVDSVLAIVFRKIIFFLAHLNALVKLILTQTYTFSQT